MNSVILKLCQKAPAYCIYLILCFFTEYYFQNYSFGYCFKTTWFSSII